MDINKTLKLAFQYYQQGKLQQAEGIYKEILKSNPHDFYVLNSLGNVLQEQHRYDEAIDCYQKAIKLNRTFAGSYFHLGSVLEKTGEFEKATHYYQEAIKYDPKFGGSYNNLGNVFRKIGQEDKAIPYFERAIEINPTFWGSYYNLGEVLQNKGQLDKAISLFQKALQLNPQHIASLNNLGNCLTDKRLIDEAITCYQKAIEIQPNHAISFYNLGFCLEEKKDFDNALFCYRTAIQFQPDYVEAHFSQALLFLLLGNYEEGLKEYEWRWKAKDTIPYQRKFSQPLWQRTDIRGLTILLHAEQGFGDVIQFVRYAPFVAELGAKVIIESQKGLKSLLKNIEGVEQVISQGEYLPSFDIHCPIASLPLIFDTRPENIPAKIPYIFTDTDLVKQWGNRVLPDNSKFKIGLVWSGNPDNIKLKHKSFPFKYFTPLVTLSDFTFYSLQKGEPAKELKRYTGDIHVIDFTDIIDDFSDTAALIENLDLTISVDTSVAHLAGAMGKPVWTLIPYKPDWRWMLNREDSPWYPTMRLFRQPAPGDWESVIAQVKDELLELLKKETSLFS